MTNPGERDPNLIELFIEDRAVVRAELAAGLRATAPHIAPKFLYDALGSRLFDAITELPEYYPTRTEAAILRTAAAEIGAACAGASTLIDLGAGNCAKAGRLFGVLKPQRYVAVDISVAFLRDALASLQREHPQIEMLGVGCDFSSRLTLPAAVGDGPRTVFYPGSSIGNFTPDAALDFLRQTHAACRGGQLLIGVDLVKPVDVLQAAYDDSLGVTAAFNLNLLRHVNHILGSDFDIRGWSHEAIFNHAESRIEMHLRSRAAQTVRWPDGERAFDAGQRLHTENSYKYRVDDFDALLRDAGFRRIRRWMDAREWFAVFVAA